MGRFFNFKRARIVHVGVGPAAIDGIADGQLAFTDDQGGKSALSLLECARVYLLLREAGAFPPGEDDDWSVLIDHVSDFATIDVPFQAVVGLRAVVDVPPWFQFLDRQRTQFEFKDYDHIQNALLKPLTAAGAWYSWDAS